MASHQMLLTSWFTAAPLFFVHPKPTPTVQFCEDGQIFGFPTHSDTLKSSISAGRDSKPSSVPSPRWAGDGEQTAPPSGGHPAAPGLSPQLPLHGCLQHLRVTLAAPQMRSIEHYFIYLPVHLGRHKQTEGPQEHGDTHLVWCLEPFRCAWYCSIEFSVTLQMLHV